MAQIMVNPRPQFLDTNGDPLVGGKVHSYQAGTSTPLATYEDKAESTANANPVILDSRGEADIWLTDAAYKIVLKDADDNTIWTVDDIKSVNGQSITTAMLADGAVTTAKLADGAVTADKLGTGFYGLGESRTITDDSTITITDDIILIDAISKDITVSLPQATLANNKVITVKRIDDTDIISDTFVDGDVNTSLEQITVGTHPFYNLQRVQLTTSGVLPTGLSLATDYWVVVVDANTIKLADTIANAALGTAIDITAASGGGTHTITSQRNSVTVDGYMAELVDSLASISLDRENEGRRMYCNGTEWLTLGHMVKEIGVVNLGDVDAGAKIEETAGSMDFDIADIAKSFNFKINSVGIVEISNDGLDGNGLENNTVGYEKLKSMNTAYTSDSGFGTYSAPSTTTLTTGAITTIGRPVLILLYPQNYGATSILRTVSGAPLAKVVRISGAGNLTVSQWNMQTGYTPFVPTVDFVAAGTHTYSFQVSCSTASLSYQYFKLLLIEL